MSRNIESSEYTNVSLRDQILSMPPADRLNVALHVIDMLTGFNLSAYYANKYNLTNQEARIVAYLDQRVGKICARESIYAVLYHDIYVELKIIDVFICKIRKKIPDWIVTHWGIGYSVTHKLDDFDVGTPQAIESHEVTKMVELAKNQPRVTREYPKRTMPWTSSEDDNLRNMVNNCSTMVAMLEEFERTERAIIERMAKLGIREKFLANRFRHLVRK